jgi:hypothetical protein
VSADRASDRSRPLIDRILALVHPTVVPDFTPPPEPIADDVWGVERKLRMFSGLAMPTKMTIVRLPGGGLFLHSPVPLDPGLARALDALGPVQAALAPNSFHYLFLSDYARAYPGVRLFLAPGLRERVPSVVAGTVVAAAATVWHESLAHLVFGPVRGWSEVVLFHRPSRTLVLTDLAFNLKRFASFFERIAWRLTGVPASFGPSRTARLTFFRDAGLAGPHLRRMLEWNFERIVVAHGDVVADDACGAFRRAFAAYLA